MPRVIEATEAWVRPFVTYLDHEFDPGAVRPDDLRHYILHLQARHRWQSHPTISPGKGGLSPFTIATHVRTIKAFWAWLAREEFITDRRINVVPTPKTPVRDVRPLSAGACHALIDVVPEKGFTGMRDRALLFALLGLVHASQSSYPSDARMSTLRPDNFAYSASVTKSDDSS